MQTPQSGAMNLNGEYLAAEVSKAAAAIDTAGRARLLEDLVIAMYEAVKFDNPEGQGFDGHDGPERTSLAAVVDAARDHRTRMAAPSAQSRAQG